MNHQIKVHCRSIIYKFNCATRQHCRVVCCMSFSQIGFIISSPQTNLLLDTEESFPKTSPLALGSTISEEKTTQIQSIKFPKKVHLFTIHELHNFDSPSLSTIFLTDTKHINEIFFPPPYWSAYLGRWTWSGFVCWPGRVCSAWWWGRMELKNYMKMDWNQSLWYEKLEPNCFCLVSGECHFFLHLD